MSYASKFLHWWKTRLVLGYASEQDQFFAGYYMMSYHFIDPAGKTCDQNWCMCRFAGIE